jgi:hypothetical protein
MVTNLAFLQDFFGYLKNGQKKCPKLKTQNTFGKIKSFKNIINSQKQLKEPIKNISNISFTVEIL